MRRPEMGKRVESNQNPESEAWCVMVESAVSRGHSVVYRLSRTIVVKLTDVVPSTGTRQATIVVSRISCPGFAAGQLDLSSCPAAVPLEPPPGCSGTYTGIASARLNLRAQAIFDFVRGKKRDHALHFPPSSDATRSSRYAI